MSQVCFSRKVSIEVCYIQTKVQESSVYGSVISQLLLGLPPFFSFGIYLIKNVFVMQGFPQLMLGQLFPHGIICHVPLFSVPCKWVVTPTGLSDQVSFHQDRFIGAAVYTYQEAHHSWDVSF